MHLKNGTQGYLIGEGSTGAKHKSTYFSQDESTCGEVTENQG